MSEKKVAKLTEEISFFQRQREIIIMTLLELKINSRFIYNIGIVETIRQNLVGNNLKPITSEMIKNSIIRKRKNGKGFLLVGFDETRFEYEIENSENVIVKREEGIIRKRTIKDSFDENGKNFLHEERIGNRVSDCTFRIEPHVNGKGQTVPGLIIQTTKDELGFRRTKIYLDNGSIVCCPSAIPRYYCSNLQQPNTNDAFLLWDEDEIALKIIGKSGSIAKALGGIAAAKSDVSFSYPNHSILGFYEKLERNLEIFRDKMEYLPENLKEPPVIYRTNLIKGLITYKKRLFFYLKGETTESSSSPKTHKEVNPLTISDRMRKQVPVMRTADRMREQVPVKKTVDRMRKQVPVKRTVAETRRLTTSGAPRFTKPNGFNKGESKDKKEIDLIEF